MNLRAILRRIRKLELQEAAASWKPGDGGIQAKLEAIYAERMARPILTSEQIDAATEKARAGHAARRIEYDKLSAGPNARIFVQLLKMSDEIDPRKFTSPDEYAAAFGAYLRAGEDDRRVRQAGQAGRTERADGGGAGE